jgi:hypothetical protein
VDAAGASDPGTPTTAAAATGDPALATDPGLALEVVAVLASDAREVFGVHLVLLDRVVDVIQDAPLR